MWEQAVQLYDQISGIPNLTNDATEALSLYRIVSTFNVTVFVTLSQLESVSTQTNMILVNLTEIVAINVNSYHNEINESLQLSQDANEAQTSATEIERIASVHQEKLNNITDQLQALSEQLRIPGLGAQVQQLDMDVVMLQQLAFDTQQQRIEAMSLFNNVTDNYTRANTTLQSARQEYTTAVNLELYTATQLQVRMVKISCFILFYVLSIM